MSEQTSGEEESSAGGDARPFLGSWFALLKDVEMVCSDAPNNW